MSIPEMFLLLVFLVVAFVAYRSLHSGSRREKRQLRVTAPDRSPPENQADHVEDQERPPTPVR
jgi:hypothetical protein